MDTFLARKARKMGFCMDIVKITFNLHKQKRSEIKMICAAKDIPMKEFIDNAIQMYIDSFEEPLKIEDNRCLRKK